MPKNILAVQRLERRAAERDAFFNRQPAFLLHVVRQSLRDHVVVIANFQRDVLESFVQ